MFRKRNIQWVADVPRTEHGREVSMESPIAQRVTAYVDRTGETRESLAKRLGMSRGSLYEKLSDNREFTLSEAYELSKILGCSVNDLMYPPERA